jgi:hypothetical protein
VKGLVKSRNDDDDDDYLVDEKNKSRLMRF